MIGAGGFGLRKCILIESDLRAFDHSTFSEVKIFLQIFLQLFACTCAMMFYLILFRQAPNIILIANIFLPKLSVCVTTITISSYDVTYWKHSLTIATSLESNCSPPALLARHTRSNASLSSWGDIWLGWGGQGSKEIRALENAWTQPRK